MEKPIENLATTAELAQYLGLKPNTLDHWASGGKGPAYVKIEGARRYDWADVRDWIESRKVRH